MLSEQGCAIDQAIAERHFRTIHDLSATLRRNPGGLRPSYERALFDTQAEVVEVLEPYARVILDVARQTTDAQAAYFKGELSQEGLREVALDAIQENRAQLAVDTLSRFAISIAHGRSGIMDFSLQFLSEIGEIEAFELVFIQKKGVWLRRSDADMLQTIYSLERPHGLSIETLWQEHFGTTKLNNDEIEEFYEARRELFRLNTEGGEDSIIIVRGGGRRAIFSIAKDVKIKFPERKIRKDRSKFEPGASAARDGVL